MKINEQGEIIVGRGYPYEYESVGLFWLYSNKKGTSIIDINVSKLMDLVDPNVRYELVLRPVKKPKKKSETV